MKDNYLYFIRIGEESENLYKIGTTNNIQRRMSQHRRYYEKPVTVLWVSNPYSKYTALRVEERTINQWKETEGFYYIRNDRFIIDPSIRRVSVKVRKEWVIDF